MPLPAAFPSALRVHRGAHAHVVDRHREGRAVEVGGQVEAHPLHQPVHPVGVVVGVGGGEVVADRLILELERRHGGGGRRRRRG